MLGLGMPSALEWLILFLVIVVPVGFVVWILIRLTRRPSERRGFDVPPKRDE
jgi:hypothetical protein